MNKYGQREDMEIFDMPSICVNCKNKLTEKEKKIGLPLCQDCIDLLTNTVISKGLDENKVAQEVDNFSRFILASGNLFKLDKMTIIQCCFNIFMKETAALGNGRNLIVSEKIFKDAIRFMYREVEIIKDKKNKSPDNEIFSIFDGILKDKTNTIEKNKKTNNKRTKRKSIKIENKDKKRKSIKIENNKGEDTKIENNKGDA